MVITKDRIFPCWGFCLELYRLQNWLPNLNLKGHQKNLRYVEIKIWAIKDRKIPIPAKLNRDVWVQCLYRDTVTLQVS